MNIARLYKVILSPHVSEKTARMGEYGQYVFKVLPNATKMEVKQAVELLFKVKVVAVNLLNVKGKAKMFGRKQGHRKDWKKAYVTLQEGQSIDFEAQG